MTETVSIPRSVYESLVADGILVVERASKPIAAINANRPRNASAPMMGRAKPLRRQAPKRAAAPSAGLSALASKVLDAVKEAGKIDRPGLKLATKTTNGTRLNGPIRSLLNGKLIKEAPKGSFSVV